MPPAARKSDATVYVDLGKEAKIHR